MVEIKKSRNSFLALLALKDGPKHGYEIATYIKDRSRGFFSVSFGNLYPILHKLESEALVKGAWKDIGETKNKKVYSLTSKGKKALDAEELQYKETISAFASLIGIKA